MISKQIQSGQFDRAKHNPVLNFAQDLKTVRASQAETLKLDNTAQDIDPREGYVRYKAQDSLVAGPNFYRNGNFVCEFDGENARLSTNLDSDQKGAIIHEYDYNHADQTLSVRAYSVDERDAGPLQDTGSIQTQYDLNQQQNEYFSDDAQKMLYGVVDHATQNDNKSGDGDPRPGRYENSMLGIGGGTYAYDAKVRLEDGKASGSYRTQPGTTLQFEVGRNLDGSPDLEGQDIKLSFPSQGMEKQYHYHADTKILDINSTLTDELSFYDLGLK